VPAVNIGERQTGRVFGKNVIQAGYSRESISAAIRVALEYAEAPFENPYGDMKASERIVTFIEEIFRTYDRERILWKRFVDRM
jgi:UDP-N-acetylglucosamine 2-epimerase